MATTTKWPNKGFWTRKRGRVTDKPKTTKFGKMTNHNRVLELRAKNDQLSAIEYLEKIFLKGEKK